MSASAEDSAGRCPRCGRSLAMQRSRLGWHATCPGCGGRQVNMALLRRELDPRFINGLWQIVRDAPPVHHHDALDCPSCRHKMHPAGVERGEQEIQVDVCRQCQVLWLDTGELEILPGHDETPEARQKQREQAMPAAAREALAILDVERLRDTHKDKTYADAPPEWWQVVMTLFGFPVEEDAPEPATKPWVTWTTAVLCLLAFALQWLPGGDLSGRFGFVPADPWRHGGLTLLTSFFLHGGILHLLGNLWFLSILGDNCESMLGHLRYGLMLVLGALAGLFLHAMFDARVETPLIGASAGISAVLVYYGLSLPQVRLVFCFRLAYYPFWFRLTAIQALGLWVASQCVLAVLQARGSTNVSALGHLGGALAGLVWFALLRRAGLGQPARGDFSDPQAVMDALRRKNR